MMWVWVIAVPVIAVLAYIRLAPTDAKAVHRAVEGTKDTEGDGHCIRVIDARPDVLARLDATMIEMRCTQRIAGSVEAGHITYVTRSRWIGFPDYTTLERSGGQIKMFARLRFGRSDFGVNRARLEHLIKAVCG